MARLVIFDLDGTLLNTIADLGTAVNHALSLRGFPLHSLEAYRGMVGHGVRNLITRALPEEHKDMVEECLKDFLSYYIDHIDVLTRPYEGVKEIVGRLNSEGWLMAVASNKFQAGTEKLVGSIFPHIPWVAVFGNREGKPLKPDTALVEEIIALAEAKSGSALEKIVFVGDSETDMKTAQNAGLPAVAVTWGFRTREELTEAGAVNFAETAEEMFRLITTIR